jgi:hypothetical protein
LKAGYLPGLQWSRHSRASCDASATPADRAQFLNYNSGMSTLPRRHRRHRQADTALLADDVE